MGNTVTTENGIEVYETVIHEYLDQYIQEHRAEDKNFDLHKESQNKWNAVLLYIYKYMFRDNVDILKTLDKVSDRYDIEKVNRVCDIYIELCYEYDKEISILGFCKLTGIVQDTIYSWGSGKTQLGSSASEIYKKLSREREESLSAILVSGKRNPVGVLGVLNHAYSWNMPGVRESKQDSQPTESIEQITNELALESHEEAESMEF